ncbi:MAG: hypothetical protein JXR94_16035 [Candidatus Hydrogenedentes bacterium]|nr:hypothetical protein [Candidatus Hydrogenedentota bacterium]
MTESSTRATRWSGLIIGLGLLAILAGIGGLLFGSTRDDAPEPAMPPAVEGVPAPVAAYVRDNTALLRQLGKEPEAAEAYGTLVGLWGRETSEDTAGIRRRVVGAFPNESLGLYALRECIASQPAEADALCEAVLAQAPDSRVACLALDHLLKGAAGTEIRQCDAVFAEFPGARVGAFALLRKGDYLLDRGDGQEAARHWMKAWIARADIGGDRLHNRLCAQWMADGMWWAPLLLGMEFRTSPALTPLKTRLLEQYEAMISGDEIPGHIQALIEINPALEQGDAGRLASELESLSEGWPEWDCSDAFRAESALAFFLLQGKSNRTFTLSLGDSLGAQNRLHQARMAFLERYQASCQAIPPDLRAIYALSIANRFIEDMRPVVAAKFLLGTWEDPSVPQDLRERLLACHADILSKELGDHETAGRECAAYCDAEAAHGLEMRKRAGTHYYEAGAYEEAMQQFERLEAETAGGAYEAIALFMRGMSAAGAGRDEVAEALFAELGERCPGSDLAAESLGYLARLAVAKGNPARAQEYLDEIQLRYPDWDGARQYGDIAQLQEASGLRPGDAP